MNSRQRGFTLLEAIVALVIFSSAAAALYAWQHVSLMALERARAHTRRVELVHTALGVIDHVNPMLEPKGTRTLSHGLQITWQSRAIRKRTTGKTLAGYPSLFDLALYNVYVQVRNNGQLLTQFNLRKVGYEQARQPAKEF